MKEVHLVKSRKITLLPKCIAIISFLTLTACSDDRSPNAADSALRQQMTDTAIKPNNTTHGTDSVLPFEQDTQKIMETLDLLDSIRQAKNN